MKKQIKKILFMVVVTACINHADPAADHQTAQSADKNIYTLVIKDENTNKPITVKLIRFNAELYETSYKVFIMNNKIKEMYYLAQAAVKQQPQDLLWRRRLAKIAIWNGQYQTALDQWIYIANKTKNYQDIEAGKKIAKQIYNYADLSDLLWLQLSTNYNQKDLWLPYINAVETAGKPEIAIDKLQMVIKTNSDPFFRIQLANLYQSLGEMRKEKSVINSIQQKTPALAMQNAIILINQHRFKDAFRKLNSVQNQVSPQDREFWTMYAQLAWSINNRHAAAFAYQHLIEQGNTDLESYQRYITLQAEVNLAKTLTFAKLAMSKFKTNYDLPLDVLALQQKLGRWNEMGPVIDKLPPTISKNLNYQSYFWILKAERWQYTDQQARAIEVYLQGMKTLPESTELKRDYLWFLINTDQKLLLPNVLARIQSQIPASPELWGPTAVSYYLLNQPIETRQIVSLYSQQLQNNLNDPHWQLDLADIYDQTDPNMDMDFVHLGDQLRRYTWPLYLKLLLKQDTSPYYDQLLDYMKLSQQEAAGDPTLNVVAKLMMTDMTPEAEELIVAWAIEQNNFAFAQAVYSNYLTLGLKPPPTAILSLALYNEDRYLMRKLLEEKSDQLQYRDRVDAAERVQARPLAQSLAMQGLREHPNDYQMYDIFTDVMLKSSNHVDIKEDFYQYGSLQGMRTYLAATYFVTPGISLTPYTKDWFVHTNNTTNVAYTPTPDGIFGLKSKFTTLHGDVLLDVAGRKSLETFPTALIKSEYIIFRDLNAQIELGYKQLADDTEFLYEGGYKHYASLLFDYTFTQRDLFTLELEQKFFYTQDNRRLASGQTEELGYEHYFWQSYPDPSIRFYARANQYQPSTSVLRGPILKMSPPSGGVIDNNVNLAIPPTNTEVGITVQVGTTYLEDYTHSWKPFAAVTVLRNSDTGMGRIINFGIAKSVLGRDHLAFYYESGADQAAGVQKELTIGLSYRYYF